MDGVESQLINKKTEREREKSGKGEKEREHSRVV